MNFNHPQMNLSVSFSQHIAIKWHDRSRIIVQLSSWLHLVILLTMFRFVVLVVVLQSSLPYYRQHAVGVKLSIDSFEQTLGQDILWMDLRVRKYNRTSTVINGTIHIYQEGINDYKVWYYQQKWMLQSHPNY